MQTNAVELSKGTKTPEQVRKEIDWREAEILKLRESFDNSNEAEQEHIQLRIANLTFALHWCKWFLNEV